MVRGKHSDDHIHGNHGDSHGDSPAQQMLPSYHSNGDHSVHDHNHNDHVHGNDHSNHGMAQEQQISCHGGVHSSHGHSDHTRRDVHNNGKKEQLLLQQQELPTLLHKGIGEQQQQEA